MSRDYIIVRTDFKGEWEGNYGPMKTYSLELEEAPQGSGVVHHAEMNQKPTTAPPQPGETISGSLSPSKNPDFPPKFKKEFKEGGFFGGGGSKGGGTFKPRDPSEIAGARHAHNLLVAAHCLTPLPLDADGAKIEGRIDNLETMACILDEKTAAISDAAKDTGEKKDDSLPF